MKIWFHMLIDHFTGCYFAPKFCSVNQGSRGQDLSGNVRILASNVRIK